ncbi:AAA family ATPase [Planomonospora corallina]|uniref:Nuclease SbcCD subunit C n=1 Tax=Planomonospora corallina TaxID=1806052 RepID=A0ABV8I3K5_9ACTN
MRPHRLEITAFGSFPGEETVDFDALTEAGLFLIHGSTGAGKTTVLDALCFALYGRVPGQRDSARSLRCDHAPPDRGPRVRLEVTIRGRRLRLTRSPAWQRPKKKGAGTTLEQAKVVLEELLPDGEWRGLTTRMDEAGDLVGGLLGMNLDQFCQVAMLPQGDFARFLRADGDERRKVLERLFSVKVYAAAESWLADRRTEAFREQQALRRDVDSVVDRVQEAAGPELLAALAAAPDAGTAPLPGAEAATAALPGAGTPAGTAALPETGTPAETEALVLAGPAPSTGAGQAAPARDVAVWIEEDPLDWAGALAALAGETAERALRACAEGETAALLARRRLEDAVALADRRRRHADALTRSLALEERAEERADLEAVLAEAARADRVLPLIREAEQRAETAAKARSLAADAIGRARPLLRGGVPGGPGAVPGLPGGPGVAGGPPYGESGAPDGLLPADPGLLSGLERERREEITRLDGLRAEEPRLEARRRERARTQEKIAGLTAEQARIDARLQVLPGLRDETEARLTAARLDAARVPAADAARAAAARFVELETELAGLDDRLRDLTEQEAALAEVQRELPVRLEEATARRDAARADAARIPVARAAADRAGAGLDAVRRRDDLTGRLETARTAATGAVDHAQRLLDRLLGIRQARIDGMAAELAAGLSPGTPCVVCGSCDHPAPAAPAGTAATSDDEQAAQSAYEAAQGRRQEAENTVTELASRLEAALADAGELTAEQAVAALAGAEREQAALAEAAAREPALASDAARVAAEVERARTDAGEVAGRLAGCRARQESARAEQARLIPRPGTGEDAGEDAGAAAGDMAADGAAGRDPAAETAAGIAAGAAAGRQYDGESRAARELRLAEQALRRLRASADAVPGLEAEAGNLTAELERLRERSGEIAVELAACRTEADALTAEIDRLAARLDEARGADPTLTDRLDRLADEAGLLREAAEAVQRERTAQAELETARARASAAAAEEGFRGIEDARAAVLTAAEQDERSGRLRALDRERAAVDAQLADPELVAAAAEPDPDLAALEAARDAADAAYAALLSARDRAGSRRDRLEALRTELAGRLEEWLPAAERHRLADRLAALAGGNSADNRWSMRLSAYVLGERLRQVVASANERLDHMSGGRYLLQYDLRRAAGDRSRSGGGLGLRILDGWTGVDRDPATLSGGESFITSLALALGLADVVTAEAGGVELGTLFVDEGFGTLDEDTLDGVLDILDGLRDGGRAVGIVSHVGELRTRVPARLHIRKERHGSTIHQ